MTTAANIAYYYRGTALTGAHQQKNGLIFRKKSPYRYRGGEEESQKQREARELRRKHPLGEILQEHYPSKYWYWRAPYYPEQKERTERIYNGNSVETRKKVRNTVAALMKAAHDNGLSVYLSTISFSNRWTITDEKAAEICRSFCLRLKYQNKKTASPDWWVRVAERQPQTGTIHFHIVHTSKLKYIDAKKMQQKLRNTLGRLCKHIPTDELARWNGYDLSKVKDLKPHKGQKIGNYVSSEAAKIARKMSSYVSKGADGDLSTYRIMPYSSSYEAKDLPIGECHPEQVYRLFDGLQVCEYLTAWKFDPFLLYEGKKFVTLAVVTQPKHPPPCRNSEASP